MCIGRGVSVLSEMATEYRLALFVLGITDLMIVRWCALRIDVSERLR